MTIKSAIEQIQTEMIKDIDIPKSAKTELANQKALRLAICSLQAWSEVLNELEEERGYLGNTLYQRKAYAKAIDIINKHLAEIKE